MADLEALLRYSTRKLLITLPHTKANYSLSLRPSTRFKVVDFDPNQRLSALVLGVVGVLGFGYKRMRRVEYYGTSVQLKIANRDFSKTARRNT